MADLGAYLTLLLPGRADLSVAAAEHYTGRSRLTVADRPKLLDPDGGPGRRVLPAVSSRLDLVLQQDRLTQSGKPAGAGAEPSPAKGVQGPANATETLPGTANRRGLSRRCCGAPIPWLFHAGRVSRGEAEPGVHAVRVRGVQQPVEPGPGSSVDHDRDQ